MQVVRERAQSAPTRLRCTRNLENGVPRRNQRHRGKGQTAGPGGKRPKRGEMCLPRAGRQAGDTQTGATELETEAPSGPEKKQGGYRPDSMLGWQDQTKPPEVLPSPARGRTVTFAPGSAPEGSRGASTSCAGVPSRRAGRGARSASAAGSPRLLPFLEGRGRRGRGGRGPARPPLPAPPAAPGAGPAAALPGLRGSLGACHFLPGREGGGCRPGAAGRAGGGGWRGGASGAAGPLPAPPLPSPRRPPRPLPRVPRFLPAPVAMTTPLPGLGALGPRGWS
ncbi:collagen alpha-2(I) chain-like [Vulpes lagopus]|uniref:collagen alpha-2(I) chain-like n=1 Tax=Vulpes lagopus TaxID=494514 RepID=UPI001BC9B121|nr:collagen alpha-2(I) chain-like [Vulpes lagopus]